MIQSKLTALYFQFLDDGPEDCVRCTCFLDKKKKNNMKENSHKLSIHLYKAFMGNK